MSPEDSARGEGEARPFVTPDRGRDADSPRPGSSAPPSPPVEEQVFLCDLCGSVMLNLHCKLVCERCGYKRDCSDP